MKLGFIHSMQFTDAGKIKMHVSEVYNNCNARSQSHNEMDTINFTKWDKKSVNIRTTTKEKCSRQ